MEDRRAELVAEFEDKMDAINLAICEAKAILDAVIDEGFLDGIKATRADAYWASNIKGTVGGDACMHSMEDTLNAIKTGETD